MNDFSDEALTALLPTGYVLLNGHDKRPSEPLLLAAWEKRTEEWRRIQLRKACVAVREVVTAIKAVYPNAGVIAWVPEDDWRATVPPFSVRMQYSQPSSKDSKRPSLADDLNPMAKTE